MSILHSNPFENPLPHNYKNSPRKISLSFRTDDFFCLAAKSPSLNLGKLSKFVKNVLYLKMTLQEIKTHEKQDRKNPRIKLIQTTYKLIKPTTYKSTGTAKLRGQCIKSAKGSKRNSLTERYIQRIPENGRENTKSVRSLRKKQMHEKHEKVRKGITSKNSFRDKDKLSVLLQGRPFSPFQTEIQNTEQSNNNFSQISSKSKRNRQRNNPNNNIPILLTQSMQNTNNDKAKQKQRSNKQKYFGESQKSIGIKESIVKEFLLTSNNSIFNSKMLQNKRLSEPLVLNINQPQKRSNRSVNQNRQKRECHIQSSNRTKRTGAEVNNKQVKDVGADDEDQAMHKRPKSTLQLNRDRKGSQIQPW